MKNFFKVFSTIVIVFLVIVVIGVWFVSQKNNAKKTEQSVSIVPEKTITVGDEVLAVAIADTTSLHQQGLSGVTELGADEGMLFIFNTYDFRSFWMKDMVIPIDIIWIRDHAIIGYEDAVQIEDGVPLYALKQYTSPDEVRYVLEVRAGLRQENGWGIGTEIQGLD